MRCEQVAMRMPDLVDGGTDLEVEHHLEQCLRCQAEMVRYRRLLRGLRTLRTQVLEPAPGLLGETLTALEVATERSLSRTLRSGRRLAYAGAIGGAAVATAATAALLLARSRRTGLELAG